MSFENTYNETLALLGLPNPPHALNDGEFRLLGSEQSVLHFIEKYNNPLLTQFERWKAGKSWLGGWQDIRTAPRDGSRYLIRVLREEDPDGPPVSKTYDAYEATHVADPRLGDMWFREGHGVRYPTHWMPTPIVEEDESSDVPIFEVYKEPRSLQVISDVGTKAPAVFVKRRQPFSNSKNIVGILKTGGIVRGGYADGNAGPFEVLTKKEVFEGLDELPLGVGRWVPSNVVDHMIRGQEVYIPAVGGGSRYVECKLRQDEIYTVGFPDGWGVRHVPSTGVTQLFRPLEGGVQVACLRPMTFELEEWVASARRMASAIGGSTLSSSMR